MKTKAKTLIMLMAIAVAAWVAGCSADSAPKACLDYCEQLAQCEARNFPLETCKATCNNLEEAPSWVWGQPLAELAFDCLESKDCESFMSCVKDAATELTRPEPPAEDGDTPDGDTPDGDEPDGDEPDGDEPDGDEPDGDEPDGDEPDGDDPDGDDPDGDEPAPLPLDNAIVRLNNLVIAGGFDLNGDDSVDNAFAREELAVEKAIIEAAVQALVNQRRANLLLVFDGLEELPAAGDRTTVDILGILGKLPEKRGGLLALSGLGTYVDLGFYEVDPLSYDDEGQPRIAFRGATIATDVEGVTTVHFEADTFDLSVARQSGETYSVTLHKLQLQAVLTVDEYDNLVLDSGTIGGAVPFQFIIDNAEMLKEQVGLSSDVVGGLAPLCDIDLDDDGDVSTDPVSNPDGISVGIQANGAPALIVWPED